MPRTNLVNAVDDELAAPVAAPDLTIEVVDGTLLPPVPFYLVVDPFNDTQGREYMLCTLVVGTTLTVTRNLAGSDSDIHDAGDIVRITIAAQHIEDIWDAVDTIPPPQTFLHGDLTDVTSSQHHPRYIDSEAVSAMGLIGNTNPLHHDRYTDAEALAQAQTLDHDHATPIGVHAAIVDVHHARYTDAEAIAAVGPIPPDQTFLHADLTDVGSLPSAHHPRYLDSEAVAAVQAAGVFLELIGGTVSGALTVQGEMQVQTAGGAILKLSDSVNVNTIRSIEDGPASNLQFLVNGATEILRLTPGQANVYGRVTLVNDAGIGSGFMEAFAGVGRHVVRYGAGANSADGNFWQVIGPLDTSPEQVAFRFSVAGGSGQPFSATTTRGPYTDMPATALGQFNMRNIAHSTAGPSGGISGDVWLVYV